MRLGEIGPALLDLALPLVCASCGRPGAAVCDACLLDAWGWCWPGGPRLVSPQPRPPGLPPVVAVAVNDGAVRRLLHAYKDEDRRDVRAVLAEVLAPGLQLVRDRTATGAGPAPAHAPELLAVPVPTSAAARRRRGDRPLEDLVRATCARVPGCTSTPVLRARRAAVDQSLLGSAARAHNLVGTMVARPDRPALADPVVLVDDLLTTGATLVEATRALGAVGVRPVAAVVVAATQRRPSG